MRTRPRTRRALALAAAFGVLLLGGRLALAAHAYEHDVGAPAQDCELCDLAQVCGNAAVADSRSNVHTPQGEPARGRPGAPTPARARFTRYARAPPLSA